MTHTYPHVHVPNQMTCNEYNSYIERYPDSA